MENSCIMFHHVKRLKDRTTMVCRMYDSRYSKVLTIACRDINLKMVQHKVSFGKN
jgi:hypothetical protein